MNKYLSAASILLYMLSIAVFFLVGAFIPAVLGFAEQEGMTGGATVLMWGLSCAVIAFIMAVLAVRTLSQTAIVRINWALLCILLVVVGVIIYRVAGR